MGCRRANQGFAQCLQGMAEESEERSNQTSQRSWSRLKKNTVKIMYLGEKTLKVSPSVLVCGLGLSACRVLDSGRKDHSCLFLEYGSAPSQSPAFPRSLHTIN